MRPIRIQRKRTKGWRMPENTVYVGRGSQWGNPFYVGKPTVAKGTYWACSNNKEAVKKYTLHVLDALTLEPLRGKNLACWCNLSDECHADILLELAND